MTDASLRALFDAALDLPPHARAAYLQRACADDALRERVRLMLDAATHDTADALPLADADDLAAAIGDAAALRPGTRIGDFTLCELLGEGGYASVFRATREHDGVTQQVALKLLRQGVHTAHARRQFRRERQALAQLRHANIASFIEGGVTEAGLAYIALQLVDGVPITQFARERRLDLRARLGLMLQVCRAVEAAHRALIVHRDLKPSNVLVTHDGRAQLLDFGVAKLLDNDDETQTRAAAFTPAYAAPEQLRHEAITTATDVYALGVLLGELATGQRLNDGSGRTPSAQVSSTTEPGVLPAPPRVTQRLLRGDLDNIVLKAIEAEPARRYPTAGALADDIERHLAGRPVAAHPPSRLYRARKFIARNKGGVASTLAFTLAVFAALGIAVWQAGVARDEAARASEQTRRAEAVRDFLVSVFDAAGADAEREHRPTLEQLVDDATQRALADDTLHATTRADLLGTLGSVSEGLGAHAQALAAINAALALAPQDDSVRLTLHFQRATTLLSLAKPTEAVAAVEPLRAQYAARRDLVGNDGLRVLAMALSMDNRNDEAVAAFEQARAHAATLAADDAVQAALRLDTSEAEALVYAHRYAEGLVRAEAGWQRWSSGTGHSPRIALRLLQSLSVAADISGDTDRADQAYRDAIALAERHYVRPHPDTAWQIGLYGSFLVSRNRYDDAEPYLERGLSMRRQLLGESHPDTLNAIAAMGRLRAGQLRPAEAQDWFAQGVTLCRAHDVKHLVCPRLLASHANMLLQAGDLDRAAAEVTEAVDTQTAMTGADSPQVAGMLTFLSRVQVRQGRYDEALVSCDRALANYAAHGGGPGKEELGLWLHRGLALYGLGRIDEALEQATRAVARQKQEFPDSDGPLFSMLALQARALSRLGHVEDAAVAAREALAVPGKPADVPAEMQAGLERIAEGGAGY